MDQKRRRRVAILLAACVTLTPLLTLARSAAAAEGDSSALQTWPVSYSLNKTHNVDELSREFDFDEDGHIDDSRQPQLPDILNPQQFTLHVSACAAPKGFTSIDWVLARPGEDPLPPVNVTECASDIPLPDKPFPEAREYDLTAIVHYPETPDQTVTRRVRVQDVFMVGLGDSYGSGEGNPMDPTRLNGVPVLINWDNDRCHRSRLSGQEQAARELDMLPGVTVTFLHLACSGAKALEGILQPYAGLEAQDPPLPSQIHQAAEYIDASTRDGVTKRYPDVVVTSIGGNDAGFADIVTTCLIYPAWIPVPIPVFPFVIPVDLDSCYEEGEPGDQDFDDGLAALPALYEQIDTAVDGGNDDLPALCDPNDPCTFMITEYPDGSTDEHGDPCEGFAPGFTEDEFEWVIDEMVPRLNGVISTEATRLGWTYVDGIRDNFTGHGICAEDDWLRDITESFEIQFDKNGAFHPDWAGHLFGYTPEIVETAREVLGFPYTGTGYFGPLYGGTGQPDVCDTTIGDGDKEFFAAAPATDVTGLNLPSDIAFELQNGRLPRAQVGANTCGSVANVSVPHGQTPTDMRAGYSGCPNDPRPCVGSSAGSASLHFPTWSVDEVPTIEVSAQADVDRGAGDDGSTLRHRSSSANATGTTAFLAAATDGSPTVSGEIVVDLTGRAQSNGAAATGESVFTLEANNIINQPTCDGDYCTPSTKTQIGGVEMDLTRYTCQRDPLYDRCNTRGDDSWRLDTTVLQAWTGGKENMLIDIHEEHEGAYGGGIAAPVPVRSGLPSPSGQIRIPYSVPAGSVVTIKVSAESYTTALELCTAEINNFTCSAQARSGAVVSFDPDVATGVLMPLAGFKAPAADTTAPTITATPSGPAGSNGWFTGAANVALQAADNEGGSGVASVTYAVDGGAPAAVEAAAATVPVSGDGTHTVTYSATDVAGNVSETGSATVKIDATSPTVTVTPAGGAEYTAGDSVATELACSDTTSGVATCEGPETLDTSAAGDHTATFTATDNAGNTTTHTVDYTVTAPAPPPPPPATDGLSVSIPELGFAVDGNLTSGGFTITRNASGQPTAVIGTGTLAGPGTGSTTVTILAAKVGTTWIGAITVNDPSGAVNASGTTFSRTGVTAVGADGATGTFTNRRPARTITWTVTDRV